MVIAATYNKDEQIAALRKLADHISVYIETDGPLPTPLRNVWINWINDGKIPTSNEVNTAISLSVKWKAIYNSTEGHRQEIVCYDNGIRNGNLLGKAICEGITQTNKQMGYIWKN